MNGIGLPQPHINWPQGGDAPSDQPNPAGERPPARPGPSDNSRGNQPSDQAFGPDF